MDARGGTGPERLGEPVEDPVERQYRYLLRAGPVDALEAAHVEALSGPAAGVGQAVLDAVREAFVAGGRLTPDRTAAVARLLVAGARRDPGAFLRACDPDALRLLAAGVVGSEAASASSRRLPSRHGLMHLAQRGDAFRRRRGVRAPA
jgi:hypothetical protein